MNDPTILVVDDNASFCTTIEKALHRQGYLRVQTASDGWQALESVKKERPDLVLLDIYMPGIDGLHLITAIHKIDKDIPVVMLTCEGDEECRNAAASLGAADYLVKPLSIKSIVTSISSQLSV
jgi:two-component system nitrogen regulation response regulator NtrX